MEGENVFEISEFYRSQNFKKVEIMSDFQKLKIYLKHIKIRKGRDKIAVNNNGRKKKRREERREKKDKRKGERTERKNNKERETS